MTLPSYIEDTSKALYSDGDWHILLKDVWAEHFNNYEYPHKSVIYHQCSNPWKKHHNPHVFTQSVQYRVEIEELGISCGSCGEVCPKPLQGLWKLHNFDSIQSTTPDSSIP